MDLRAQMIADRRLRDSAKALFKADVEFLRGDIERKGLGERAVGRLKSGAVEVYEEAVEVAADNKGALAALFAAILVWFARNPIFAALGLAEEDDGAEDEEQGTSEQA